VLVFRVERRVEADINISQKQVDFIFTPASKLESIDIFNAVTASSLT
jgi:hypothetical protein